MAPMEQEPDSTPPEHEVPYPDSGYPQISRSASYLATFGFHRDPFPMAPDDQRFFHPKRIDILLTEILHALLTRKGLILLSGSIGQGKTTLCHRIHHELKSAGVETILFSNTFLQGEELLAAIARAFGVAWEGHGVGAILEALRQHFLERTERGVNCAILLDDAQELTPHSLEMVRLLSNLEHNAQKLVQILLVGQEKLSRELGSESLEQLASRVVAKVEARPFTYGETVQYLTFKMITAGCNECVRLSRWAMGTLHRLSGGNPRRINILMDRALYAAYANDQNRITRAMLHKVAREVRFRPTGSPLLRGALVAGAVAAGVAVLALSGAWNHWKGFARILQQPTMTQTSVSPPSKAEPTPKPAPAPTPKGEAAKPAPPPVPPPPAVAAPVAMGVPASPATGSEASLPEAATTRTGEPAPVKEEATPKAETAPVATPAEPPPVQEDTPPAAAASEPVEIPEVVTRFLEAYSLAAHGAAFVQAWEKEDWDGFSARLEQETGLRLLRMRRPSDWVKRIYPILKVRQEVHLLIWRPAPEVAGVKTFTSGHRGEEIRLLQEALARLGFYTLPVDGMVGAGVRQALSLFQQAKGLPVNGQPNDITLFFLTHALQEAAKP